jgi:hypothetical protein
MMTDFSLVVGEAEKRHKRWMQHFLVKWQF